MSSVHPKISIVVPSFNQGRFLGETLESIVGQNYPNLELIVVDGGSTDESVDIIRKYEDRIAYWVSKPDRGQAHALNMGFERATGGILGWQNSDDLYEPGAFAIVASVFSRLPHVDVVYGNFRVIDAQSRVLKARSAIDLHLPTKLYENSIVYNQTMFWRAELHRRVGPINESLQFVMDAEFVFRMIQRQARFMRVPAILGSFRIHPRAKTAYMQNVFREEYETVRQALFPQTYRSWKRFYMVPVLKSRRKLLEYYNQLAESQYPFL